MNELRSIIRSFLSAFAICRVVDLPAVEEQRWGPIASKCVRFGSDIPGRLPDCVYCLTLWISLPLALWLSSGGMSLLGQWRAFSGAYMSKRVKDRNRHSLLSLPITESLQAMHLEGETSCAMAISEAH
jgi:hypothetical protein